MIGSSSFRSAGALTSAAVACLLLSISTEARAEGWKWELTPYIWAADVSVDAKFRETDIASVTIDFSDIVDALDMAALIHFEGGKGKAGFYVDLTYLAVSDDQTTSGRPLIPDGTRIDVEIEQLIATAGGFYRLTGDDTGLDLLFGVRLLDVSLDTEIDFPSTSILPDRTRESDESFLDGFVGLRYRGAFSERWIWSVRGDVGTGDSDLTWQGFLAAGVNLGKKRSNTLFLAYRHLAYEFDEEPIGITVSDVDVSGAMVGFRFGF